MTTPIPKETQDSILADIQSLVPPGTKNAAAQRHIILVGVILGLQAVDHALVPPHWLMNVMAHRTDRLFS